MLIIKKSEVLRYLGYNGQVLDDTLNNTINSCIEECSSIIVPRFVYDKYEIENIKIKNSHIEFSGNDIKAHLSNSQECIIMAATVGIEIEKKIRFYELKNLNRSLILDACATTAVEALCDNIENIICQSLPPEKHLTSRFSPGYGDLDISYQTQIIGILNADKKIGLKVTETNLLTPRKSVTAIMGISDIKIEKIKNKCENCSNYERCEYRTNDKSCR